jgi:hypothetical protein
VALGLWVRKSIGVSIVRSNFGARSKRWTRITGHNCFGRVTEEAYRGQSQGNVAAKNRTRRPLPASLPR